MTEYKCGKLIIEGKTKKVYELLNDPTLCLLESKDRITAGDGVKSHELKGKAAISTATTAKVFQLLNEAGVKTAFVNLVSDTTFVARKCQMVPIEWVTRRLATGSFLRRHPGVPEGYRFNPPLQETFFKDDANHDPQWSEEQIISAGFKLNGITIGKDEFDVMQRTTLVVFEILERAWATRDCALIDMKIEFGVDANGEIMVSDIIDSDSWRLWPSGDKRLMKDKQVYRNLTTVTQEDLDVVKRNFKWVADQLDYLIPPQSSLVVILMGSPSDEEHCKKIAKHAKTLGLRVQLRVSSAHKATQETLRILAEYEGSGEKVVLIAVAGRSNGLGPVLSGNTPFPVINCPPCKPENISQDLWSSINVPSGIGCTTVVYPESAALAAAQIHALHDHLVWSRLRVKQLENFIALKQADVQLRNLDI
ncbi:bifunctional phosphoribosylaminoimidazole carboxylase/phosphoribosylaminoimidazole succinocarboxamide synthetase [Hylaeus volcanicus]|uniref:bifunctional phosphoribosylaminoimidazole carboxylase/phosphoribosylaminoimidazole succinocarboxamide synthetase n=1 Tax=Hylaeus volcanicus TaxID=313075 RepID=UPI0023B7C3F1|nr:bifunctional phosphoribosylaminoimidazole carboxylase/phosphoribosylaminoimidazole succinocarboxamide synthetase [Hylaeus volcanicus]